MSPIRISEKRAGECLEVSEIANRDVAKDYQHTYFKNDDAELSWMFVSLQVSHHGNVVAGLFTQQRWDIGTS